MFALFHVAIIPRRSIPGPYDCFHNFEENGKRSRRDFTHKQYLTTNRPRIMANGFLDIPPEVRVLIYDYALYHHETDGVISPLPDVWEGHDIPWTSAIEDDDPVMKAFLHAAFASNADHSAMTSIVGSSPHDSDNTAIDKMILLVAGQRYRLSGYTVADGPHFEDLNKRVLPSDANTPEMRAQLAEWQERKEALAEQWHASAAVQSRHDCGLDCLVQPPISRVSKLIRKESLASFYGVNHFHLEFHHWSTRRGSLHPLADRWTGGEQLATRICAALSNCPWCSRCSSLNGPTSRTASVS